MQGRAGSRQVTVSAKKIKVGINGFGRIGRNFLRCHELRSGPDVQDAASSAVCMPGSPSLSLRRALWCACQAVLLGAGNCTLTSLQVSGSARQHPVG